MDAHDDLDMLTFSCRVLANGCDKYEEGAPAKKNLGSTHMCSYNFDGWSLVIIGLGGVQEFKGFLQSISMVGSSGMDLTE